MNKKNLILTADRIPIINRHKKGITVIKQKQNAVNFLLKEHHKKYTRNDKLKKGLENKSSRNLSERRAKKKIF